MFYAPLGNIRIREYTPLAPSLDHITFGKWRNMTLYGENVKEWVENMKKYVENVKEYVKNMKKEVKNMKEYIENM